MRTILLLLIAVALIAACTKEMRYTNEELKTFEPKIQEQIKKGEISPGMTMLQVRYAWGAPSNVTILPPNDKGQERVEWQYTRFPTFKTILRFTDGALTEIISSEPGIAK